METLNETYDGELSEVTKSFLQSEAANINLEVSQETNRSKNKLKKEIPMTPSLFDPNESQSEEEHSNTSIEEQDATLESVCSMESQMAEETSYTSETKEYTDEESTLNVLSKTSEYKDSSTLTNETTMPTEVVQNNLTNKVLEKKPKNSNSEKKKKIKEEKTKGNSDNEVKKVRGRKSNFPKSTQINDLNNIAEENHAQYYVYSANEKNEDVQGYPQNSDIMTNKVSESQDIEETQQKGVQNEQKEQAAIKRKPRKRFTRGTQVQSPNFKASKTEKRKPKMDEKAFHQLDKTMVDVKEKDVSKVSKAIDCISLNDTLTEQNVEELDHDLEPTPGPSSANTSIDTKSEHSYMDNSYSSIDHSPPTYRIEIERDNDSPNERSIYIALPPATSSKITNINVKMTKNKYPKDKKVTFQETSVIDLTEDDLKIKKEKFPEKNKTKRIKPGKENDINRSKYNQGGRHGKEKRRKPMYVRKHCHHGSTTESSDTDFSSGHCSCSDCNEDYGSCSCSNSSARSSSEEYSEIDYHTKTRHKRTTRMRY